MSSRIYWIDLERNTTGRVAILARPLGADRLTDEVQAWRRAGIDVVVSLLTDSEVLELELEHEESECSDFGVEFHRLPIHDRDDPESQSDVRALVELLHEQLTRGRTIGVHCRAGIGRSALIAACVLCQIGYDTDSAWKFIKQARGVDVPDTPEQRDWVRSLVAKR